jgi:hypothetical protein
MSCLPCLQGYLFTRETTSFPFMSFIPFRKNFSDSPVSLYAYHDNGIPIPYGNMFIRGSALAALWTLEGLHVYWSYLVLLSDLLMC